MKKFIGSVMLAIGLMFTTGCTMIETGNVGVSKAFSKVNMDELQPGWRESVTQTVYEVNGKEITLPFQDMRPKSKDNLTMQDFDFDVSYQVNPAFAAELYVKYMGDAVELEDGTLGLGTRAVTRFAREAAYNAVAKQEFATMQNKRDEIALDIEKALQSELDTKVGKNWITVTNITIRNITTDKALEDSIRAAAQVEFQVRKKNEELALAQAEADRLRVEAKGQADANEIIARSITAELLRMKEIEASAAFASNKDATVMVGISATPLIGSK